jgi:phosphatidylserine/phosphatidylglycerophosphate/cardiolipin synthase-like enzyme
LLKSALTPAQLAQRLKVDVKTAERWISGREPYRKHRYAVATLLGVDEAYLWPNALSRDEVAAAAGSEIITLYPHRWAVPREVWAQHFAGAEHEIDMLTMAGLFLAEDSGTVRAFREKAEAGVRVRLLISNPDAPAAALREHEEDLGPGVVAFRIRNVLALLRPLRAVPGIEFRLHDTCLYTSIFRADDDLIVNTHVYGVAGSNAPAIHLRRVPGGDMVSTYEESFEKIWASATPLESST